MDIFRVEYFIMKELQTPRVFMSNVCCTGKNGPLKPRPREMGLNPTTLLEKNRKVCSIPSFTLSCHAVTVLPVSTIRQKWKCDQIPFAFNVAIFTYNGSGF